MADKVISLLEQPSSRTGEIIAKLEWALEEVRKNGAENLVCIIDQPATDQIITVAEYRNGILMLGMLEHLKNRVSAGMVRDET